MNITTKVRWTRASNDLAHFQPQAHYVRAESADFVGLTGHVLVTMAALPFKGRTHNECAAI
jgi:hypothetical protein